MPSKKPTKRPKQPITFNMRVNASFLSKLDDLRASGRPVKSRSDYIRKLVEDAKVEART